MRFAQPTLAIASPFLTVTLFLGLLFAAFSSVAQPAKSMYVGAVEGSGSTLAAVAASSTNTTATLEANAHQRAFYRMLEKAGLRTRLRRATDSYTVFAPTDEAFANMAAPVRNRLDAVGLPVVKSLVRGHLVQGVITPEKLVDGAELETLDGTKLRVSRQADGSILLDGRYRLRDAGQRTTNGIVYTIDTVMTPRI